MAMTNISISTNCSSSTSMGIMLIINIGCNVRGICIWGCGSNGMCGSNMNSLIEL